MTSAVATGGKRMRKYVASVFLVLSVALYSYFVAINAGVSLSSFDSLSNEEDRRRMNVNVGMNGNQNTGAVDNRSNQSNLIIPCFNYEGEFLGLVSADEFWSQSCRLDLQSSATFFHVGKGGGGTVSGIFNEFAIDIKVSHPLPSRNVVDNLLEGETKTLVINVRDPVDRFVSAFDWRSYLFCSLDDKRIPYPSKDGKRIPHPSTDPEKFCLRTNSNNKREAIMLANTYNHSVSNLAEALCDGSPTHKDAVTHAGWIGHAQTNLRDWLELLVNPELFSRIQPDSLYKLVVVPMAKQSKTEGSNNHATKQRLSHFDMHILQAIRELLIDQIGLSATNALVSKTPPKSQKQLEQEQRKLHSSSAQKQKPPKLSALGECCLSRYLRKDYRLIRMMLSEDDRDILLDGSGNVDLNPVPNVHPLITTGCSWGTKQEQMMCKEDLVSILRRRLPLLDHSRGSCSNVVAAK